MVDRFQGQIGPAFFLCLRADQVEVFVPTHSEIEGQVRFNSPIILKIKTEHFGSARQIEIRIAGRCSHAADYSRSCETLRQFQDGARQGNEIDLECWIELKETTELRFPQVIDPSSERVIASVD